MKTFHGAFSNHENFQTLNQSCFYKFQEFLNFTLESESTTQLQNAHTLPRPVSTWVPRRAMAAACARASATEAASAARDRAHMVVEGIGFIILTLTFDWGSFPSKYKIKVLEPTLRYNFIMSNLLFSKSVWSFK